MLSKDTDLKQVAEELRAAGYDGPIKSTKIGDGYKFAYRWLLPQEYEAIVESLPPGATRQEMHLAVVQTACYPQLTEDEWLQLGMGFLPTLNEKVEILSGRPLPNAILHFASDEELASFEAWDEPTDEEIDEIHNEAKELGCCVKMTKIMGFTMAYRSVTGAEFNSIQRATEDAQQKALLELAIVWPKGLDWDKLPGLMGGALEQKIYFLSGYQSEPDIEEDESL